MNSQYLPPYHAEKINGLWSVVNAVGQIDAACDCRHDAEDLAHEMTSHANRLLGIGIYNPDHNYTTFRYGPCPTPQEDA